MNPQGKRAIASAGLFIALFLSVYYVLKTHEQGDTRWYFLVMAMGILLMLLYSFMSRGRTKRRK